MTQAEMILAALKAGDKLTPLDALNRFGCFRLGARIWDLKQIGHPIEAEMIEVGDGKHVARYFIQQPAQRDLFAA